MNEQLSWLTAHALVMNALLAEMTALLSDDQRALLRTRFAEHAQEIAPIDEYEPRCTEYRKQLFGQWDEALGKRGTEKP